MSTSVQLTSQATVVPRRTARRAPNVSASTKAVVVHSGARDRYQVALALSQAGLLECLVTDFFWSEEAGFGKVLSRWLPSRVLRLLRQRSAPGLPPSQVKACLRAALGGFLLDKAHFLPYGLRRWMTRKADDTLGRVAGKLAKRTGSQLLSYSYYGYAAFKASGAPGMMFQMHPHPATMRRLLLAELEAHPDCAASLQQEWELNLPEDDFQRLVTEASLPVRSLAASSFTKRSLVENGVAQESITVVPYGIDLKKFHPGPALARPAGGTLKLLLVGRINQRKGIKYLLQALSLLPGADLELTVCGRVLDGLDLFKAAGSRVRIRPSVGASELVEAYQQADLFVLPSIAEGFGQVLLEALACGLPVLATTHTAAPDLLTEGEQGFVVEPRRPDLLANRIAWALSHREELLAMRAAARSRAEQFPWLRFQQGVSRSVQECVEQRHRAVPEAA